MNEPRAEQARPAAVVTGLETIAGLQTARILSRREVPVIGIVNDRRTPFRRTRTCQRVVYAPADALVAALRLIGPTLDTRGVIVPSTDRDVLQLLDHRDELARWFHVVLPDRAIVEQLMDKARFLEFALANDLPVPRTVYLDNRDDARSAAAELRFPAVIKPPVRDARWDANTRVKAFKLDDPAAFLEVYDRASAWADQLVAQEWIEGGEDQLYSCNAYFDEQSRPLVTFVSRKLRQWPPQTGRSALAEECRNDTVLDTTIELFRIARFWGLAYLEMKRDERDGRHYIVEPNIGRATGRSAIAEAGGVDLLLTMYCDVLGLPLPDTRVQRYVGAKWIYLRWDLQAAQANIRDGSLTPGSWVRSLRGPRTYAALDLRDPVPFVLDFARIVTGPVGRAVRRRRDHRSAAAAPSPQSEQAVVLAGRRAR